MKVMELGRMTIEEIKQKTSLCFLLNPNIPEEEKICVIEKVMATKATIVSKAALCNIITYILKQNAKLQEKLNIRSCQIAELKAGKQEKQMAAAGEKIGTVRLYGKHGRYEIKGESRK